MKGNDRIKISLPEELVTKIEEHPEINWAFIASNAIKKYLKELELHNEPIGTKQLHELSEYSLKEFLENEPDLYTDHDLIKRYK